MPTFSGSDVVAIVAIIAGPVFAYWMARQRNEHETNMARDARSQDRLEEVYRDVMALVLLMHDWVDRTRPIVGPKPDPPEIPSDEAQRTLRSRLRIFGSPDVQARLRGISHAVREFQVMDVMLDEALRMSEGSFEQRKALDEKREQIRHMVDEIADATSRELTGRVLTY